MTAQNIQILNRTAYDLTKYSGTSLVLPLVKNIPVASFREFLLKIRVHASTLASGTGKIGFVVYASAPSDEDPSVDFYGADTVGTITPIAGVTLDNTVVGAAPFLMTAANLNPSTGTLTPFGDFITVGYVTVGGTGTVTLSGVLTLKG